MLKTLAAAAALLAGVAHAAPIAVYQTVPQAHYVNLDLAVDAASLRTRIEVLGATQFDALVTAGQTVVVSLTGGAPFDQLAASFTNGVTDTFFSIASAAYVFNSSVGGEPTKELGVTMGVGAENADLPDLAGYVIDEFRITSTVTCWDPVNTPTKDTCSAPIQQSKVELFGDMKFEIFGHLADATVPEPGSAALSAAALLALATARRRRSAA